MGMGPFIAPSDLQRSELYPGKHAHHKKCYASNDERNSHGCTPSIRPELASNAI
jgi:hypothetical protein